MTHKRGALVLFVVLLITIFLSSMNTYSADLLDGHTPPFFEQMNRETGLSNMSVSSIIQDKDGFLWFGTQGGLNRYDGREMKVIRDDPFKKDGLVHNLIQTMTYDAKRHELWIGTYQGISCYNIYEDTFTNYTVEEHGLSNSVIVSIAIDEQGLVWIGTLEGLNVLNHDTQSVQTYFVDGEVVRSVFIASNNEIYLGTHKGLQKFDRELNEVVSTQIAIDAPAVMLIREYEEGILTLGLWDKGLMKINLDTGETKRVSFSDNRIYAYIKTTDGVEWVGTWGGGLYAIELDGEITHFPGTRPDSDVHHSVIYALYQDTNDILWIGTNGGGITKANPLKRNYVRIKSHKDVEDSLSQGKNNLVFRDRYGQLWTAVYNHGIERIDETILTTVKYTKETGQQLGDNVTSYIDQPGWPLLIGSSEGISYYDIETDAFYSYDIPLPKENIVYSLEIDHKNRLWIGTYREGVYVYDPRDKSLTNYRSEGDLDKAIADNLVYSILADGQGRIWIGTNNGLNLLETKATNFKTFKGEREDQRELANNTIRQVFEDSNGDIWIATVGGGISKYQNASQRFITYVETDGLSNNSVVGILEDNHRQLWLSTLDGLSILNLDSHEIYTLQPEDGIGGYEFNAGHFKDEDGSLYFAGDHGIINLPSGTQRLKNGTPKLYIDGVSILGTAYPNAIPFYNDMALHLSPKENFINIKFIALDYHAPEKIRYFYRLLGQDSKFIDNGVYNQAVFSNLNPGKYTFEVYAMTSHGVKTDYARLDFIIANHWYQTPYAFAFYILLILVVIYMLMKVHERNIMEVKNSELNHINLKLSQANAQLEKLTIIDSLTGVFNRRHFEQTIEDQFKLAVRGRLPMGFIMLDIDDFKAVNDTYGHIVGDEIIIRVANIINDVLQRSTDYVYRYGGDEFLITLYDTDLNGVKKMATQIRASFISHQMNAQGDVIKKISLSMGIYGGTPSVVTEPEYFIKKADDALYIAKKEGKNRVVYQHEVLDL